MTAVEKREDLQKQIDMIDMSLECLEVDTKSYNELSKTSYDLVRDKRVVFINASAREQLDIIASEGVDSFREIWDYDDIGFSDLEAIFDLLDTELFDVLLRGLRDKGVNM